MEQTRGDLLPEDVHDLFRQAKDSFVSELSTDDQMMLKSLSEAHSAIGLLDQIEQLKSKFSHMRYVRISSKLKNFTYASEPYFEVIGTIISSHPEWAAVCWGALRLVLQVRRHILCRSYCLLLSLSCLVILTDAFLVGKQLR